MGGTIMIPSCYDSTTNNIYEEIRGSTYIYTRDHTVNMYEPTNFCRLDNGNSFFGNVFGSGGKFSIPSNATLV
jgi:hypothetical protein